MNALLRVAAISLLGFTLSGCDDSWSWHEKFTLAVTTPEGVKTASSVTRAELVERSGWMVPPEATGVFFNRYGEAIVLEIAPNKYVFAVLGDVQPGYQVFFPTQPPLAVVGTISATPGEKFLSYEQMPLLVTFEDIKNPKSIKKIDPMDFAKEFGRGYQLESASISITKEPITRGKVDATLPWLARYYDRQLDGQTTITIYSTNRLANSLAAGAFDTEKE